MPRPSLSIGIEEEYQTIDPQTRDLRSHIASEILPKAKLALHEAVKPEMHQSVIEVGTRVCKDVKEARENIQALRREMITLASQNGMLLAAGSTHPFSDWKLQEIYPDERYRRVVEDMQLIARANLVFGLHVHIGIEDRNTAIHIMNSMRYFLPHILALSSNSPFWMGMNTGFKSYRVKVLTPSPTGRSMRISSTCWSEPTASTMARRSGGTSGRIRSLTRWKCECAIFPCDWTKPWPSPR
jgi:carboxylate-amine ligase